MRMNLRVRNFLNILARFGVDLLGCPCIKHLANLGYENADFQAAHGRVGDGACSGSCCLR